MKPETVALFISKQWLLLTGQPSVPACRHLPRPSGMGLELSGLGTGLMLNMDGWEGLRNLDLFL